MTRVAVIGSAGRGEDAPKMSNALFGLAVARARTLIKDYENVELVSGGAGWMDHIAVTLFLDKSTNGLELYLPCKWDGDKFLDTGASSWRTNPGRTANQYHREFSRKLERNTLDEIAQAKAAGARLVEGTGFHARNSQIAANCDVLIAFTWGNGPEPKDGGTLDTWKKCKAPVRIHVPLSELVNPPSQAVELCDYLKKQGIEDDRPSSILVSLDASSSSRQQTSSACTTGRAWPAKRSPTTNGTLY
jgi:hypothetical protein